MGVRLETSALDRQGLAALRRAFARSYGIRDERGYTYFAGLHGLPLPTSCPHATLLFLPWHRAYLYFFERALQDLDAGASLPWWDWTSTMSHQAGVPAAFRRNEARVNENPLATGPVRLPQTDLRRFRADRSNFGALSDGPSPWTLRDPDAADELPRPETVRRALAARSFGDFSALVQGIHNSVHTWVGGAMSLVSVAAYDPLFWAHHAMVDRLWYLWQLNSHVRLPADLLDRPLPPFPMTVRHTLDIGRLGYEYAVGVIG